MATPSAEPVSLPSPARRSLGTRAVLASGLVAAGVYLVMVTWMFWSPDFSLHQFKAFFANDQQSYLTIAVNFAYGDFRSVEPFTQTGTIDYPRAYYQALGLVAHVTHSDPVVWWWMGSLGSQALLAGVVGAAGAAFSGRRWAALLGPVALTAGVFGVLRGTGWLTLVHNHAVIWGSFAEFFAGNGATVAVALSALGLLALVGVVSGRIAGRRAWVVALFVAALLGAMASVHTYTFLTSIYVVTYVVAFRGLLHRPGRVAAAAMSVALVVGLFVVGPEVAADAGPLTLLVGGLLPAVPGVLLAVARDRRLLLGFLLAGLGAAPQVVLTAVGVSSKDPFLLYRQDSSGSIDLGVPLGIGLFHGSLLLVALALILAAGVVARQPWWTAMSLGAGFAWVLLWTNDSWGANQEPYRLWLNGFAMLMPLVLVVGAWIVGELGTRWVRVAAVAFLALALLSLSDYLAFSRNPDIGQTIDFHTPQLNAVASATADVSPDGRAGLVLAGPCVDPKALKIRTGLAVAYENVGMAWSSHHEALVALGPSIWSGHSPPSGRGLDADLARRAGVGWVVTDTPCAEPEYADPSLKLVRSVAYRNADGTTARIRLWRLN